MLHFKLQAKVPIEATQGKAALAESRRMLIIKEIKEFRR